MFKKYDISLAKDVILSVKISSLYGSTLQCCFKVKGELLGLKSHVKEDRDSGMICINSKNMWDENNEPYVHPKHYNQVLFYPDVLDKDWWFVLRHDPRSKHLFENNNVIMPNEEDNLGEGNEQ